MIGAGEIILIVGAVVLVFGASQIPKVARSLGEGLRELKKAMREAKEDDIDGKNEDKDKQTEPEIKKEKKDNLDFEEAMSKEKTMPFWDHLVEIRNRLLVVVISVFLFSILGYLLFPIFYKTLSNILNEEMYALNIAEGFLMRIKIAFLFGIMLSLPVMIFEIVLFLLPALRKNEKIMLIILLCSALILFIFGIIFAYKSVLPVGIGFLKAKDFYPQTLNRIVSYEVFVTFVIQFLIGFGVCFQFPVVLIFLMKLNIIKVRTLIKSFKFVLILILIVAAILTPSVDVISQVMLAFPMIALYWLSILIAVIFKIGV